MKLELRPYQKISIERVLTAWKDGMRRPAVLLPTGSGKTVIFSHLISRWLDDNPGKRVVVLVHREELATQTVGQLRSNAPGVDVGIVKARADETGARVVVASVQTLAVKGRAERLSDVGMIVVDECHHYAAKLWRKVLERLGCFDGHGDVVTVGFTATMSRADNRGLGSVWEDIVYRRDILRMIMDGYLCDVRALSVKVNGLDLGQVSRKAGGDLADGSLGDAMIAARAQEAVAAAYAEHAAGRQAVAFAPTVAFAHAMAEALNDDGVTAEVITGETPSEERTETYERFRRGEVRVLCNCMVLTEGFDAPWAEVAIIARPTTNAALYTQIVGRVLRLWPGKKDALVLDLCGASDNLTLASLADLSEEAVTPKDGEGLVEALERVRKEARRTGGTVPLEDMTAKQADVFAKQMGNWSQTSKRHWPFIRTAECTYFLWPVRGTDTYCVGRFDNHAGEKTLSKTGVWMNGLRWGEPGDTRKDALPLEQALAWVDGEAVDADPSIAGAKRPWHRNPASPKQVSWARSLGIDPTGKKSGVLSKEIDVALVSRTLNA